MKPVDQTLFAGEQEEPGNCMAACIASIFEIPIEQIPNFAAAMNCWTALDHWLQKRGLLLLSIPQSQIAPGIAGLTYRRACYSMTYGPSPRGSALYHAVVSFDGEMVHDPHPSRAGLRVPEHDVYFLVIDPANPVGIAVVDGAVEAEEKRCPRAR